MPPRNFGLLSNDVLKQEEPGYCGENPGAGNGGVREEDGDRAVSCLAVTELPLRPFRQEATPD